MRCETGFGCSLESSTRLIVLAFIVTCSSFMSAQTAAKNSPAGARKPSEKLAAAMAADLGLQFHLWAESADQAAGNASSKASAADSMGLQIASQVVNVRLTPNPAAANRSLPTDPGQRGRFVDATVSQWVSQVREQLKASPYLDVHFAIGNSIGAIRNSLAIKYNAVQSRHTSPSTDQYIHANVGVVDAVLNTPDVELTAAQRGAWATLKGDLEAPQSTSERILALRGRLEGWLNQFVAAIRSSAK